MQINQELTNKLIQIIKNAQPTTSFSGNVVRYGSQTFVLPFPAQQEVNNTKQSFR
jgi:hypothetical protein